jgi:hypothetical protein
MAGAGEPQVAGEAADSAEEPVRIGGDIVGPVIWNITSAAVCFSLTHPLFPKAVGRF